MVGGEWIHCACAVVAHAPADGGHDGQATRERLDERVVRGAVLKRREVAGRTLVEAAQFGIVDAVVPAGAGHSAHGGELRSEPGRGGHDKIEAPRRVTCGELHDGRRREGEIPEEAPDDQDGWLHRIGTDARVKKRRVDAVGDHDGLARAPRAGEKVAFARGQQHERVHAAGAW